MKRSSLSFIFLLLGFPALAQSDLFIRAGIGGGISGASSTLYPGNTLNNTTSVFSTSAQLNIGWRRGRFQFETGLGYLSTGALFKEGPFMSFVSAPGDHPAVKYEFKNSHLLIPATFSYAINKNRRLSFYPGVGLEVSCNFQGKFIPIGPQLADFSPRPEGYNPVTAMLLLKFDAQYRITGRFSIWGDLAYHQMIITLLQFDSQYDHACIFNAGIIYDLHCHSKVAAERS